MWYRPWTHMILHLQPKPDWAPGTLYQDHIALSMRMGPRLNWDRASGLSGVRSLREEGPRSPQVLFLYQQFLPGKSSLIGTTPAINLCRDKSGPYSVGIGGSNWHPYRPDCTDRWPAGGYLRCIHFCADQFSRQQIFAPIHFRELVVISENKSGQNAKNTTSWMKPNFGLFQNLYMLYTNRCGILCWFQKCIL